MAAKIPFMTRLNELSQGRLTLRVTIISAFTGLLVITIVPLVMFIYWSNSKVILNLSDELTNEIKSSIVSKTIAYMRPASTLTEIISRQVSHGNFNLLHDEQIERQAIEIMKEFPQIAMVNMADKQGNFVMPKKLEDGTIATKVIDRTTTPATVTWNYRDHEGNVVRTETSTDVQYDPRERPWYIGASESRGNFWTNMYIFFTDQLPGLTTASPVFDLQGEVVGVIGMDIELGAMSEFFKNLPIGNGVVYITNANREIVAGPLVSEIVKQESDGFRPIHVDELDNELVEATLEAARKQGVLKESEMNNRPQNRRLIFRYKGTRYIASVNQFPSNFGQSWNIVMVVPEDVFIGPMKKIILHSFLIAVAIFLAAILITAHLGRAISQPVMLLADESREIQGLNLDNEVDIRSRITEIHMLLDSMKSMKTGLQAFQKYVPSDLVKYLFSRGEAALLGGQVKDLTIFFSDIEGFTSISEKMSLEELMVAITEYFDELTRVIMDEGGTVDKYIGDAIMAFWGAPVANPDQAFNACRAALACKKKSEEINARRISFGMPPLPSRFGVHTGQTIVGNIGSHNRMNYSVLGDSVNVASRLESANKIYGTRIIVSKSTRDLVADKFIFRKLDFVAVRGKEEGVTIFELVGDVDCKISQAKCELISDYERGLDMWFEREWDKGVGIFESLIKRFPDDMPSAILLNRCCHFSKNPPGSDWAGLTSLED